MTRHLRILLVGASALSLAACGGAGTQRVASVPTPPQSPSPTPTPPPATATAVNIFPNPKPETYATVGLGADADLPHIRYNAGGYYEIQMPGAAYDPLVFYKGAVPQDPSTFNFFQPASVPQNAAFLVTANSRLAGYSYSEMASWGSHAAGGTIAFGSATPPSAVPVTGSASYSGIVEGSSDILQDDFLVGGKVPVAVTGSVSLSFNFGAGTLGGSMHLLTNPYVGPVDLGTFAFKDSVYSVGSLTYSGAFDTSAPGSNRFLGRFTGPHAEETIGAWALPFAYSVDGQNHQAVGAWIAKRP